MATGHGGFRPGAGRKSQATQDAQSNKMDIAHDVIPLDRWRKIIDAQARKAEQGDTRAFAELAPWMMGGKPNAPLEVIHSGEQDHHVILWQPGWSPPQLPETLEPQPPTGPHPAVPPAGPQTLLLPPALPRAAEPHDG